MAKTDYLRVCNEEGLPFQQFIDGWCANCVQAECTRSRHGKSLFETRASSWQERLFTNVPKLEAQDERYSKIAAQHFVAVPVGPAHVKSAWLDPKDLQAQPVPEAPPIAPVAEIPAPAPVEVEAPAAPKPVENAVVSAPVAPAPALNTPNRPRQMIGGVEPKPPPPVLDPWQPKQALKPGEHLIEKGAKIRFGKQ